MEESIAKIIGAILGVLFILILIALVVFILTKIVLWRLFEKAGEKGWKAIIPYYNHIVSSEISTGKITVGIAVIALSLLSGALSREMMSASESSAGVVYAVASVVSTASFAASGVLNFNLAKAFGGSTARCVLSIFFGVFALLKPAFSKNTKYDHIKPV